MMLYLCLPLSISIIRPSDPSSAVLTLSLLLFHTKTHKLKVWAHTHTPSHPLIDKIMSATYTGSFKYSTIPAGGAHQLGLMGEESLRCDRPAVSDAPFGGRCGNKWLDFLILSNQGN